MDIVENLDKLFRQRILALPPSEQLIQENRAFETMMAGAPNPLHCEAMKTEEEWLSFRATANQGGEAGAFLPENLKTWMRKGNALAETTTIRGPAGELEIRIVKPTGEIEGG